MSADSWFLPILCEPLPGGAPCGPDLRYSVEWRSIEEARRSDDELAKGNWEPKEPKVADWALVARLTQKMLAEKTKDLRLAVMLLEAALRLEGLAALQPGFEFLRELVSRFWDQGLHPQPEGDSYEDRTEAFNWINIKLPDLVSSFPITSRNDNGLEYTYGQYMGARASGRERDHEEGRVTEQERKHFLEAKEAGLCLDLYEAAEAASLIAHFESLHALFTSVSAGVKALKDELDEKFCPLATRASLSSEEVLARLEKGPGFSDIGNRLHEILEHLDTILINRRRTAVAVPGASASGIGSLPGQPAPVFALNFAASGKTAPDGSWAQAEAMVRSGQVEQGLMEMARLAQAETSGRARFHRKLMLAEVCLHKRRDRLARAILEELNDQITKYKLDEWETTDVVGAVWTRLYRMYTEAKEEEKAGELYLRLCHLDPWQTLSWSED